MQHPEREVPCPQWHNPCREDGRTSENVLRADDPKDLYDDLVKLVAYVVVSIEPGEEKFLSTGYLMVSDRMTRPAFVAWVIAIYIQSADPPPSHEAKQYLRVNYSVLERWDPPYYDFEEEQVRALRAIGVALADGEAGQPGGGAGPEEAAAVPAAETAEPSEDLADEILAALASSGKFLTVEELAERTGAAPEEVEDRLAELKSDGSVQQVVNRYGLPRTDA